MIDVLVLAAALAQTAQPAAEPPRPSAIKMSTRIMYADGRSESRELVTITTPDGFQRAQSMYVSIPNTLCSGARISERGPQGGGERNTWQIGIGPVRYAPQARTVTRAQVLITAQRLPVSARSQPQVAALPAQNARQDAEIDLITGVRPVASCNAVALTLHAELVRDVPEMLVDAETAPRRQLIEAELWFVHKAPDGKETSQRQTIRVRSHDRGEFYFDDLEIQTRWLEQDIKLTVEVFGTLMIDAPKDGEVDILLNLTRRYLAKQFMIGSWPKSGNTQLPTSVAVGEVVSFVLPPLQDDAGVFPGHRFSVRMRLRPLSPE